VFADIFLAILQPHLELVVVHLFEDRQ